MWLFNLRQADNQIENQIRTLNLLIGFYPQRAKLIPHKSISSWTEFYARQLSYHFFVTELAENTSVKLYLE